MKKVIGIVAICAFVLGAFNVQASEYCKYDVMGGFLTPVQVGNPPGVYSAENFPQDGLTSLHPNFWQDDLLGCYEAYLNPGWLYYFPRCDRDGSGLVETTELFDLWNFMNAMGPMYTIPCYNGCYDLAPIDFNAGAGTPVTLGAALIDGVCADVVGNYIPNGVELFADVAECAIACGISSGYECPADMPAYYDPAAVHDETSIEWVANGVCAEYHAEAGDGVLACSQTEQAEFLADMNWIMTNYPFTNAVVDGYNGAYQSFRRGPDALLCSSGEGTIPEGFFDDIAECWHGAPFMPGSVVIRFDWNVNYYEARDAYEAYIQETYPGGYCELDNFMGTPTGFHATDAGSGWTYHQVRATAHCDFYGCRCDATVKLYSDGTDYFVDQVTNDSIFTIYQGSRCEDPRFDF